MKVSYGYCDHVLAAFIARIKIIIEILKRALNIPYRHLQSQLAGVERG